MVLLVPLLVMSAPLPATYFPFIVGKALYARVVTEIVFGLWIVLIVAYPRYRQPKSWILAIFALFLLGSLIAALAGVSVNRSLWSTYERMQGVVDLLHWFGFVLVASSVLRTFASWRTFISANVVVSVVVALMGISQRFGFAVLPFIDTEAERIDATLGNPVFVGAYMLVAMLTALALLAHSFETSSRSPVVEEVSRSRRRLRRRQRRKSEGIDPEWLWRAFWASAVVLDFVVLLMAGARGALIGLAVTLGVVAIVFMARAVSAGMGERSVVAALRYLFTGPAAWLKAGTVVGLLLILAGVLTLSFARESQFVQGLAERNQMVRQLAAFGTGEDSTATRLYATRMGLVAFAQRPLVGWGPENFAVAYDRNVGAERFSLEAESYDQAHNKVVEELTTKGLVGFVPFAAMWLLVAATYVRAVRRTGRPAWHFTLLMGAATLGYFVQNLFLFETPATALQVYLLLGFAVALETSVGRDPELVGAAEAGDEALEAEAANGRGSAVFAMPWLDGVRANERLRQWGVWLKQLWKAPEFHVPLVIAAVVLAVIFLNYWPYAAARSVENLGRPGQTLVDRLEVYDEWINRFPALGNYPRREALGLLTNTFRSLTPEDQEIAIRFATAEFEAAREAEPEEWRVYESAASFFQSASATNPGLLVLSRELAEEAARLAPERVEIYRRLVIQHMFENDVAGAQAVIDEYLGLNPDATFLLRDLITGVANAAAAQEAEAEAQEGADGG